MNTSHTASDALKNLKIFTQSPFVAGLPSPVFYTGILVALFLFVVTSSWIVLVIAAALYYGLMYQLHRYDQKILPIIWSSIWDTHTVWKSQRAVPLRYKIKEKRG